MDRNGRFNFDYWLKKKKNPKPATTQHSITNIPISRMSCCLVIPRVFFWAGAAFGRGRGRAGGLPSGLACGTAGSGVVPSSNEKPSSFGLNSVEESDALKMACAREAGLSLASTDAVSNNSSGERGVTIRSAME